MKRLSAFVLLTTFVVLSLGWSYLPAAPQKTPAPAAPIKEPDAPAPIDQSLTFSETMLLTIGLSDTSALSADQIATAENFFAVGDTDPKVKLVRRAVYLKAVRHGVVPKGTPIETINWSGLIALIQSLIPLILMLINMFHPTPVPPADAGAWLDMLTQMLC
jgi:hypothetical protein